MVTVLVEVFKICGIADSGTVVVPPLMSWIVYSGSSVQSVAKFGTARMYPFDVEVLDGILTEVPMGKYSGICCLESIE